MPQPLGKLPLDRAQHGSAAGASLLGGFEFPANYCELLSELRS
jgi:hypothetical protein